MINTLTHTLTDPAYVLITILVCALCTQVTRWLPFLLFGGKKEVPRLVRYLGAILPAAIMAVLVVYCLKGITPLAYPYGLPELISVAAVVALHLWKGNTLASILRADFMSLPARRLKPGLVRWPCGQHGTCIKQGL